MLDTNVHFKYRITVMDHQMNNIMNSQWMPRLSKHGYTLVSAGIAACFGALLAGRDVSHMPLS